MRSLPARDASKLAILTKFGLGTRRPIKRVDFISKLGYDVARELITGKKGSPSIHAIVQDLRKWAARLNK